MTTRFDGRKFTFAQPDGSQIQVRGFGDQHHAVFETLDGFTLVKNPTNGFYEVARLAAACSRTRAWRPRRWSATSAPERAIPENDPAGVSDTIEIGEALTISSLAVGVSIVHSFRGDLRVTLTTPWSTVIELHPKGAGGGAKDLKTTFEASSVPALATLRGRSTRGKWRLTVQDLAPADTGRLERWSLLFTAVTDVHGPLELSEALGTPIPDAPSKGIARVLQAQTQERVGSVEVALDITHTWIGDLRVVLTSPAGTRP
jgi:subtilisin-like proprotein convertase family protein